MNVRSQRKFKISLSELGVLLLVVALGATLVESQFHVFGGGALSNPGTTYGPGDVDPASYIIFKEGSTYYAKNGSTRMVDYSGSVFETVMNSSINSLTSGGKIFITAGTYTTNAYAVTPNMNNVWLQGAGINATILKSKAGLVGGDADIIRVTKSAPYFSSIRISDMTLDASAATAGNGMSLYGIDYLIVENIYVKNPFGYGIAFGTVGGTGTKIEHPTLRNIWVTGERNGNDAIGGGGITRGDFQNIYLMNNAGAAWDTTNTEYSTFNSFHTKQTTIVSANWAVSHDFGAKYNTYTNIHVDGAYFGIYFGSTSDGNSTGLKVSNFYIRNVTVGIDLTATSGNELTNVQIENGEITAYDRTGIATAGLVATEVEKLTITNLQIHDPITADSYAMRFQAAPAGDGCKEVIVENCNLYGTANKIHLLSISNYTIKNNRGFITEKSGTAEASDTDWIAFGVTFPGVPQTVVLTVQEWDATYFAQVYGTNSTHFELKLYDATAGANEAVDKTISWYAEYTP